MRSSKNRIEIYRESENQWRWRLKTPSGSYWDESSETFPKWEKAAMDAAKCWPKVPQGLVKPIA